MSKSNQRQSKMKNYLRILKKSLCFLIVLFIFICLFFLQFHHSNKERLVDSKARFLKLQHEFERKTLLQSLRRASMSDNTVILTFVNETWARPNSILDIFLESFQIGEGTKRLLNHLLIIAEDAEGFRYCKSRHPHCFHLKNSQPKFTKMPISKTRGSFMLSPSRLRLLQRVIEMGYNVVYTNADVMWLRNPLTEIVPTDLSISCEIYPIDDKTLEIKGDGGFFHVLANDKTNEFIKNCNLKRVLYPDSNHQSLCKFIENDDYIDLIDMKVKFLDESKFGKLCHPGNMNQISTIQSSCCKNIDSKIHDLKLVLDDWRTFKELSATNSSSKLPLSWSAPHKCI